MKEREVGGDAWSGFPAYDLILSLAKEILRMQEATDGEGVSVADACVSEWTGRPDPARGDMRYVRIELTMPARFADRACALIGRPFPLAESEKPPLPDSAERYGNIELE